ncbi:SNF5-domain-containing protein [Terfezia boudieri ATCC MYA-4762]|uniref:SNF5-domain-containing protein n=1 Tax=Terfezia boudieri ATCC MYA-4762 TaxID=1051890 RepID=A0A3N4LYC4_9PEZI|nr:SNF5-domain-containing protein [Terfezia boudieri ATCC MYA-4762]
MAPQAFATTYPTRLNTFNTGLITPIIQAPSLALTGAGGTPGTARTTKRGTQIINYAEAEEDDDIYEDNPSRGSVALQTTQSSAGAQNNNNNQPSALSQALGYDLSQDGIQRPCYILPGKEPRRPPIPPNFLNRSEQQLEQAALLPEILVPIKLDMDIDSSRRLKDTFLWNVNETLITPDHFAMTMCMDLDLPLNPFSAQIAAAIRNQVEEYASVAVVPLPEGAEFRTIVRLEICLRKWLFVDRFEWDIASISPPPAPSSTHPAHHNTTPPKLPEQQPQSQAGSSVQTPTPSQQDDEKAVINTTSAPAHPPLTPESFARATCADLGLTGEFIPTITSAIYEASLLHKKTLLDSLAPLTPPENDAAFSAEAGWRIDQESLGAGWAPRMIALTREDLEKREGDRERQVRRLGGTPMAAGGSSMGMGVMNLNGGGAGGQGALQDWERANWRCGWCSVPGTSTWGIRDGPFGPRSLCHVCGNTYHTQGILPEWMKGLHWVKGGGAPVQQA